MKNEAALTDNEWIEVLERDAMPPFMGALVRNLLPSSILRHATAAILLHDQPFGFTREDVEYLRAGCMGHYNNDLANRIEALLPPEDT